MVFAMSFSSYIRVTNMNYGFNLGPARFAYGLCK